MAGIKLEAFQGLVPRASKRLLGPMNATIARNTKLLNGEIRGFRQPLNDANLGDQVSTLRRAFRVPDSPDDAWLAFTSRDVDIVRSPLVNDGFDRYFWAGDGRPKMNTGDRIKSGDDEFFLGIPTPVTPPDIVPPAGSDATRAYVYTFVSAYGEEGPPSPPTLATGDEGAWELSQMDTTVPDEPSRNITHKNIYRTIPGNVSTNFFFVAQIDLDEPDYSDSNADVDIVVNNLLESTTFIEPPIDMEGFVVMPNGYLVGWAGKRLLFSEPYRPHAWPAAFELATEFDIVGLGVFGSTLVICTESQPYYGQGVSPLSFTTQKVDAVEPCLSRRGIVSTTAGVVYPSINGLVLANSSGVNVITSDILTKEEWSTYMPENIYAAQLGLQYIAFNSPSFGFIFDPMNPMARFVEIDALSDVEGIETDRYSGNVLILSNNIVREWDAEGQLRIQWRWQSKVYQFPKPMNFGAARVNFEIGETSGAINVEGIFRPYNEELFQAIIDCGEEQPGDPFFDDVVLLAKFDGADGATSYIELARDEPAVFTDDAELDTAFAAAGSASALFDGVDDVVSFGDNPASNDAYERLDPDNATIEAFIRFNTLPAVGDSYTVMVLGNDDFNTFMLQIRNNSGTIEMRARFGIGNFPTVSLGFTPTLGVFYHIAAQRRFNGGSPNVMVDLFFNGVRLDGIVSNNAEAPGTFDPILIGADSTGGNPLFVKDEFDGWIDSVRYTNGTARYPDSGSTYTIPDPDYLLGTVPGNTSCRLNTLNGGTLGGNPAQSAGLVGSPPFPETRQPLGGSLLYPLTFLALLVLSIRFVVKIRDKTVLDAIVNSEQIIRLPMGFKSDIWQFELIGNTEVYSIQIAETPNGLADI